MKLKQCSPRQAIFAGSTIEAAKVKALMIQAALGSVNTSKMVAAEREKFEKALHKTEKIVDWLNHDRQFQCHEDRGACKEAYAFALPLTGRTVAIRLCPLFFGETLANAAGTIIHEASHSCCGTTDAQYYKNGKQPNTSDNWANIADTYKYWAVHGFCIPRSNGKCK